MRLILEGVKSGNKTFPRDSQVLYLNLKRLVLPINLLLCLLSTLNSLLNSLISTADLWAQISTPKPIGRRERDYFQKLEVRILKQSTSIQGGFALESTI